MEKKAAVSVNSALLEFNWNLGKDISEKYAVTQYYGSRFFECVSKDLTDSIRNPQGLSVVNIRYCQRFYDLYSSLPNLPQLVEELVSVPWGQHRCIIEFMLLALRDALVDVKRSDGKKCGKDS